MLNLKEATIIAVLNLRSILRFLKFSLQKSYTSVQCTLCIVLCIIYDASVIQILYTDANIGDFSTRTMYQRGNLDLFKINCFLF